jgi:superfamily II DNA or RNA helicase
VRTQNGDFIVSDLEEIVNNVERNLLVLESYKKYVQDRNSTLIFATGVDHARAIYQLLKSEGINVGYVDGNTDKDERKVIIEQFKKMKIKVLVNVLALTTGFDAVAVDTLMLLRPTKSRILFEQILGRGLRLSPETNKTDCLVIDIQDVTRHHDLMNLSATFNVNMKSGETPRQAKKRVIEEEKLEKERQQQELLQKQEEQRKKQEEFELRAKQVKLFNKEMKNGFDSATYDWFKVDNMTYALSIASDKHYVIEQDDDNFKLYLANTSKEDKSIKFLSEQKYLKGIILYVENSLIKWDNSFVNKNGDWKRQPATENQKKYLSWAVTKWDAHKYFTSNIIKSLMKNRGG